MSSITPFSPPAPGERIEPLATPEGFEIQVTPFQPAQPSPASPSAGDLRAGRPPAEYQPAFLRPSSAPPRPASLAEPVRLGESLRIRSSVAPDALGSAVHDFIACDDPRRPAPARLEIASGLLTRYQVAGALNPADLLELADRLWRWLRAQFGEDVIVRTEWPLGLTLPTGTRLLGTTDLLVETPSALAVIDHKTYGLATARSEAEALAGQLGSYAAAAARALPGKAVSTWVHLPLDGLVAQVE